MPVEIQFIITGGTIDKSYHPQTGELGFDQTIIPELVQQSRFQGQSSFLTPFLVDSLDMNPTQRAEILSLCQESTSQNITITHGTDTIIQTALALSELNLAKTIILTGAMIPARVSHSDGLANIAQSIAGHHCLPEGVYIGFQGEFFNPHHCIKNKSNSTFEEK